MMACDSTGNKPLSEWMVVSLLWRRNGRDSVSNHQPRDCLLDRLFRRRSKKTSKLRVTGLCAWNSPVTGEFPAQMASNTENVSIWWRHHVACWYIYVSPLLDVSCIWHNMDQSSFSQDLWSLWIIEDERQMKVIIKTWYYLFPKWYSDGLIPWWWLHMLF